MLRGHLHSLAVHVPETECPINYDNLSQSINHQAPSESYGIDLYLKTV